MTNKRRPFKTVIQKYFKNFRKSQRKTIYDIVQGLLYRGRLILAEIARGMYDKTTPRHRIKRIQRFITNLRITARKASEAMIRWVASRDGLNLVSIIGHI